eukprot:gene11184-23370_t
MLRSVYLFGSSMNASPYICLYSNRSQNGSSTQSRDAVTAKFESLNVHVHIMYEEFSVNRFSDKWLNIKCALQLAHKAYLSGMFNTSILYLANHLIAVNNISFLQNSSPDALFQCVPDVIGYALCETDILLVSSKIGTPGLALYNASRHADMTPDSFLSMLVSKTTGFRGIQFLPEYLVVRPARQWYSEHTPVFIEFDGYHHRIVFKDCLAYVTVEQEVDSYNNDDNNDNKDNDIKPKVIDAILFYNEISMLKLRLQALEDYHIIIESNRTFTGQYKPLHFHDNRALFSKYLHKILHVVIEQLPHPEPVTASDVWRNEYFSRNSAMSALKQMRARDQTQTRSHTQNPLPS